VTNTPPRDIPAWLYPVITLVLGGLLWFLPREAAGVLLWALVGLAVTAVLWRVRTPLWRTWGRLQAFNQAAPAPSVTLTRRVPVWLAALEIALLIVAALAASRYFWRVDPDTQLNGLEAQWLTSTAYVATDTLYTYGYLPLWNPYHEKGEPLVDNPFAFLFNPISTAPSLIQRDPVQGIKTSVVLYAVVAATGGWFLARALGLGSIGRVLLGLLLLGKGNMVGMVTTGYYQLGVTQAYIAWVLGAGVWTLRGVRVRASVVTLAVSLTLMFWAGNIWYTLPTLISLGGLWLVWDYSDMPNGRRAALVRLMVAGLLTVGLAAAALFPIFGKRAYIGGHKPLPDAGETMPPALVLKQFVTTDKDDFRVGVAPNNFRPEFHYSYTIPAGVLLILLVIPLTGRGQLTGARRVWLLALVLFGVFLVWGIGGLQPFRWLYNHVPGLGRWRFVGRALGGASFWLAVWAALRVDGLWTVMVGRADVARVWRGLVAAGLVALVVVSGVESARVWWTWGGLINADEGLDECVQWARDRQPFGPITAYRWGYRDTAATTRGRIRHFPIEADYYAVPFDYGVGSINLLTEAYPPLAFPNRDDDRTFLTEDLGYYTYIEESPLDDDGEPCAMIYYWALPYAFSASRLQIEAGELHTTGAARALTITDYRPGRVTVLAVPRVEQESYAVVSEVAYPGWQVRVNGERGTITPVGGYLAVKLEPQVPPQEVTLAFVYAPRLFIVGAWVTLLTAAGMAVALGWQRASVIPPTA
jgi:hypothetical protein